MSKQEMIKQLQDRIAYNEDQRAYYEALHEKEILNGESDITVWKDMVEWFKGKIVAFNIAIEMAEELS